MLGGYKSYIMAALLAVTAAAEYMQWITPELAKLLQGALLGGGVAALRAGVSKGPA